MSVKNKLSRRTMIDVIIQAAIRKFKVFQKNGGNKTEAAIAVATVMDINADVQYVCNVYDYQAASKTFEEFANIYANTFTMLASELL